MTERRVLVVDDDHSWQEILGEILQDEGLVVDYAETLPAAQAALQAHSHRLAVVDLSLDPEDHRNQDGLAVLDAVRRLDPGCATILLSGFTTVEVAVTALTHLGVFTVQRKEVFRRSLFRQAVQQALANPPGTAVEPARTPVRLPAEPEEGGSGSQGLALVVDDDAGWRGILAELLGDAGYRVRLCGGFGEALGWLRRDRPVLAVIDLSLGGTPGRDPSKDAGRPGIGRRAAAGQHPRGRHPGDRGERHHQPGRNRAHLPGAGRVCLPGEADV